MKCVVSELGVEGGCEHCMSVVQLHGALCHWVGCPERKQFRFCWMSRTHFTWVPWQAL